MATSTERLSGSGLIWFVFLVVGFCAVFAPHAFGETVSKVKYGVPSPELHYPNLIKYVGIRNGSNEVDTQFSFSEVCDSLIGGIPHRQQFRFALVRKDDYRLTGFSRLNNFWKISQVSRVSRFFGTAEVSDPALVKIEVDKRNRPAVIVELAVYGDQIRTISQGQINVFRQFDTEFGALLFDHQIALLFHQRGLLFDGFQGAETKENTSATDEYQQARQNNVGESQYVGSTPNLRLFYGFLLFAVGEIVGVIGVSIAVWNCPRRVCWIGCGLAFIGYCCFLVGLFSLFIARLPWEWRQWLREDDKQNQSEILHNSTIVLQKYLDKLYSCSTVIDMANVLQKDKQIAVIAALTEGSSLRSIERITGIHHDTIGRLAVKVGQGCAALLDSSMRNLPCNRLELDEIWGFVGKKDRNVREGEDGVGSVWTFCGIDAETKLVPAFKCGNRDAATAKAFVQDIANRMAYRVQISTDGLTAYVPAMEAAFGGNVDYAQIIKTYGHEEVSNNRRYSAPEFVSSEKKVVVGNPDQRLISTSYIERLNATTRLHMRRLTRLTLAFSKKRENFEAAVALHFAYYNFVKRHSTVRCTPAMAAGITPSFWTVGDLLEATA